MFWFPITAITRDDGDLGDFFLIRVNQRLSAERFPVSQSPSVFLRVLCG